MPEGRVQQDGARLSSVVPSASTRGNGHKLEPKRFCLTIRQLFCAVWVTEPEELLFEDLPKAAWTWAWAPCSGWPCLSRGWTRGPRGPFWPQPLCDCDHSAPFFRLSNEWQSSSIRNINEVHVHLFLLMAKQYFTQWSNTKLFLTVYHWSKPKLMLILLYGGKKLYKPIWTWL